MTDEGYYRGIGSGATEGYFRGIGIWCSGFWVWVGGSGATD